MYLFYPILFLIRMTLNLMSQCSLCWETGWCSLFDTIVCFISSGYRDFRSCCWLVEIFILMSAVKLPVLMMEFLFSPLAYFLLRIPPESNSKIKKQLIGGVIPTLGRIDARKMVVSEYMLYAWTALFFSSFRPNNADHG